MWLQLWAFSFHPQQLTLRLASVDQLGWKEPVMPLALEKPSCCMGRTAGEGHPCMWHTG